MTGEKIVEIGDHTFIHFKNLKSIVLTDNSITLIQEALFDSKYNDKLKVIQLGNNNIEEIHPNALTTLINLERINLRLNNLKEIPENLFHDNSKLLSLDLSHNHIEQIYPKTFSRLTQLESVNLTYNRLVEVDVNLFAVHNQLQKLWLNNNRLVAFKYREVERRLEKLKFISIADNKFSCSFMGKMIDGLRNLSIDITDNDFNEKANVTSVSVYGIKCEVDKKTGTENGKEDDKETPDAVTEATGFSSRSSFSGGHSLAARIPALLLQLTVIQQLLLYTPILVIALK